MSEKQITKQKKWWIIGGSGILLIILCIVAFLLIQNTKDGGVKSLNQYIEALNQGNYEKMYDLISDESKNTITKDAFIERNKNIYEGIEAKNLVVKNIVKEEDNKKDKEITYEYTQETIVGTIEKTGKIRLKNNGFFKPYQVIWDSSVILPDLGNEDKVSVKTRTANRGNIEDRFGNILAGNGTASLIGLVPGKINVETKDADLGELGELLEVSPEFIQSALSAAWVTDETFVPIKTISKGNKELENAALEISGVLISEKEIRVYPYGEKAAHLTGYIQGVSEEDLEKGYTENSLIGKSGLERLYDERLRGKDGCEISIMRTDAKGIVRKEIFAETSAASGENIKTTIDSHLQSTLYDQFAMDKGTSTAMNPKTGEVLALVSTPAYNPNDFVLGISDEKWQELNSDPKHPLLNRFEASFSPGSSFKPITGGVGLQTGAFTDDEDFGVSGLVWQKDNTWGDFNITTLQGYDNPANLENALIYSDNIYFGKAALKIGGEVFGTELKKIGFGEAFPFPLDMATSQISNSGSFDSEAQLAASGFGQGEILVNPLYMASAYSAFMNDGNMMKPVLEYLGTEPEIWKPQAFSKDIAETMRQDLIQVVENPNGTGHEAFTEGMSIAGKTGTAEIKASQEDVNGTELGWFNAFIADPGSEKQLLIVSMVEDVKDRGGSHYLIPKVKEAFQK